MGIVIAWAAIIGIGWIANWRKGTWAWALPISGLAMLAAGARLEPEIRLLVSSAMLLLTFKSVVLAYSPSRLKGSLFLYILGWPGMDPESFERRLRPDPTSGTRFVRGLLCLYLGVALGVAAIVLTDWRGWLGIASLLTAFHFGCANILTSAYQLLGLRVKPLFERPLASLSLSDFWTRRWNLAFVEMNRRLFMPSMAKRFGPRKAVVGAFLISGVLHELALSYPAGGGWGGPFAYFVIQAILVNLERRFEPNRRRIFFWLGVFLPLPLLFHAPFRETFIVPLFDAFAHQVQSASPSDLLSTALWIAGSFQILVLAASFQVPSRLNWREELDRLSPLNRKLMWTYGLFIVLCIVSFAVLTFRFHGEFLNGHILARGLAAFIAIFWLLRLVIDCFYFKHEDWPPGPQFVAGHALLTSLFSFLVLTYGAVIFL